MCRGSKREMNMVKRDALVFNKGAAAKLQDSASEMPLKGAAAKLQDPTSTIPLKGAAAKLQDSASAMPLKGANSLVSPQEKMFSGSVSMKNLPAEDRKKHPKSP